MSSNVRIEENKCQLCRHCEKGDGGWVCVKLIIPIDPETKVAYNIEDGHCFEARNR